MDIEPHLFSNGSTAIIRRVDDGYDIEFDNYPIVHVYSDDIVKVRNVMRSLLQNSTSKYVTTIHDDSTNGGAE